MIKTPGATTQAEHKHIRWQGWLQGMAAGDRFVQLNQMIQGETAVYIVLGILIIAFLFFVINTIRCYMNKPKFDQDDEQIQNQMSPSLDSKI